MSLVRFCGMLFVALAALSVSVVSNAQEKKDIVDTAVAAGSFKTLVTAVQAAGLVDTLKGAGPFTVFAPTDEAFAKLPAGTVEGLLKPESKATLTEILTYHVVAGNVPSTEAVKLPGADTVAGKKLTFSLKGSDFYINGAKVITTDIVCSNGVIHVIDAVLLPPAEKVAESPAAHKEVTSGCATGSCHTAAPTQRRIVGRLRRGR